MISPDGIPNCGNCKHYSDGFCTVNPTYLGRASECPEFNRTSTKAEIEESVKKLGEWMKSTSKPPTQMIISRHHPFYKKFKRAGYSSTSVSDDGELRWFIFDKKVTPK